MKSTIITSVRPLGSGHELQTNNVNRSKTKNVLFSAVLLLAGIAAQAQATEDDNNITSGSYLGTSNNEDVVFKRNGDPAGVLAPTMTVLGVNANATSSTVSIGTDAGRYAAGGTGSNVYIGLDSGKGTNTVANSGWANTYVGRGSGSNNATGEANTFIGYNTGSSNSSGLHNIAIGAGTGLTTTGSRNVSIGVGSGSYINEGNNNVYIGEGAGSYNQDTSNNIFLGYSAGQSAYGANNILIGTYTGEVFNGDNTLMVDNYYFGDTPLIWGNFEDDQLKFHGKVGIGGNSTTAFGDFPAAAGSVDVTGYNLFVKGGILTEEIRVSLNAGWADYVFDKGYDLKPLAEVEDFIAENGHLPNVPSAKEVCENGIELGEMAKIQQEKIEELTLYLIEQHKAIEELKAQVKALSKKD
jgi:hypothetical protein